MSIIQWELDTYSTAYNQSPRDAALSIDEFQIKSTKYFSSKSDWNNQKQISGEL